MYDGSDTVILYDELAYQDVVPVAWKPLGDDLDTELVVSLGAANVRVLQACTALQEQGSLEKLDETASHSPDLMRLEMKINLLLDLVGRLLATNEPRPEPTIIRFNSLGATWRATAPLPRPGAQGVLEIWLREWTAEPIRLVGRVANTTPEGDIKVRFLPPGEAVSDLIEKLAFRRHRRQRAGARHSPSRR
ncbi:MAG TPA: PilZ domain-containing protein [Steroidobacteraceae bacterium]